MEFNPALPYATVSGGDGPAVYLQDGIYYERDGVQVSAPVDSTPAPVFAVRRPNGDVVYVANGDEVTVTAADSSSGSASSAEGYPVEITGTADTLVSSVPCDVVWIAHDSTAGATITLRDAGTAGTGIAATKTIAMGSTPSLQAGALRTQYGLAVQLSAGKATAWVRPL